MGTEAEVQAHDARRAGGDRRGVLGALLVVSALLSAANLLGRPLASADFEAYDAVASERSAQWWFALVGGVGTAAVYVLAGAGVWVLVRNRGSRLAAIGGLATGLGGILFAAGFFAFGAVNWYLTAPGSTPASFETFRDDPTRVFAVQAAGFLLAVLGVLLLAAALERARVLPRWLPWVLGAAPLLMVTLGDDGRLSDVLFAGHMAALATLGGFLWQGRTGVRRGMGNVPDERGPTFRGVDHLALTVTDVARSRRFYVEVLGFTAVLETDDSVLCVHKGTAFTLGLVRHQSRGEPFHHQRTGLDHLGLLALDRTELERWEERLREHAVEFTPITDETLGHHLNLRDPDGIALELYAPNALYAAARAELRSRPFSDGELRAKAAEVLGLGEGAEAGAPVRLVSERDR